MSNNFYDLEAKANTGKDVKFDAYKGKTVLVVNTASKCGFTPQYDGLQKLYDKYKDQGLEILGFPCDQFGNQEPGNDSEIQEFCKVNFGVNFPLFKKTDVNGPEAHPVFQYLKKSLPGVFGSKVKWNFTKFLVDSKGNPVKRFAPTVKPEKMEKQIEKLLKEA
ncbi:glutathione peroxidase [Spirochaeta cellobiosiphila]|uniref:glutathione peroxidase n=1 Tax=Spirochaeta cellobiosiphila TaxID=504483 RepID=UPI000419F618|nr:glutathione peroxidase [Spirochaeta cellobiosiphila]